MPTATTGRPSTCSTPPAGWSPLDPRHVDRVNAEAYLKSGKEMAELAEDVTAPRRCRAGPPPTCSPRPGGWPTAVRSTPATTSGSAVRTCPSSRSPAADSRPADIVLRQRCEGGFGRRGMSLTPRGRASRLDDELEVIRELGYPTYFLTVADVVDLMKDMGVRCAARGSGAGSLVNYLLGISDVDPLEHRLLMERFLSPLRHRCPTSTSTSSPPDAPRSTSGSSTATAASAAPACR